MVGSGGKMGTSRRVGFNGWCVFNLQGVCRTFQKGAMLPVRVAVICQAACWPLVAWRVCLRLPYGSVYCPCRM